MPHVSTSSRIAEPTMNGPLPIPQSDTAHEQAGEKSRRLIESLEARLAGRTEELRRADRELDAFAHSVSHDLRAPLRAWDVAAVPRVDAFLANSENVRERIARLYGRASIVVPPPADTDFYAPPKAADRARSGLLVVSALAPYKRIDDAVRVAIAGDLQLTIAGFGPEEEPLKALARGKVRFAGTPRDEELRELYRTAEAVLMPGEEDFGIVPQRFSTMLQHTLELP